MPVDPALVQALDASLARLQADWPPLKAAIAAAEPPPPPPPPPPPAGRPRFTNARCVQPSAGPGAQVVADVTGDIARAVWYVAVTNSPTPWEQLLPTFEGSTMRATFGRNLPAGTRGDAFLHLHVVGEPNDTYDISPALPYLTAADAPPPPPPPPPPSGTDRLTFTRRNGYPCYALDGNATVLVGVNGSSNTGYWAGGLSPFGRAQEMSALGLNVLRLFVQSPSGGECQWCPAQGDPRATPEAIVAEYTARGIAVIIDWHQIDFGAELDARRINEAVTFWRTMAPKFADNPLVIYEPWNEPEASVHSWAHGAADQLQADAMAADRWLTAHKTIIDVIRGAGARNVIMCCEAQAGQGMTDYWSNAARSVGSAIIARGAELVAYDPLHRVAWDWHAYDNVGWSGTEGHPGTYTMAQLRARAADYIDRVTAATDRPVLVGEWGWQRDEWLTHGSSGFHAPFESAGGSRTRRGAEAVLAHRDADTPGDAEVPLDGEAYACGQSIGALRNVSTTQWPGFVMTDNGNDFLDLSRANRNDCGTLLVAYRAATRTPTSAQATFLVAATGGRHPGLVPGQASTPHRDPFEEQ